MLARTVMLVALAGLALSGCLEGERAPLWSTYGDPVSQVPAISSPSAAASSSGSSALGSSIPGLSSLGAPTATTTTTTQQTVEVWGPPGTTITSGTIYPNTGIYRREPPQVLLPSGQPRWVYPRNDLRCDNVSRRCDRWSAPRGRYFGDPSASRAVYGTRP